MNSNNLWSGKGFLGKDVYVNEAGTMASFSLACDSSYIKDGERVKNTDWVKITCFRHQVKWASELQKGDCVRVWGKITQSKKTIDDKEVYEMQVIAENIEKIIFPEKQDEEQEKPKSKAKSKKDYPDDIPF